MFVGDRMTHPVITIHPELPIQEAHDIMRQENIRRLVVVDNRGHLRGIVSESDILEASPSEVTSLSIWEINYLMSKIRVDQVMTRDVITVDVDTPIEEAARMMADKKIGSLPVTQESRLVGIITETTLFRIFLEMFAAREPGIRISAMVKNIPGTLANVTRAIFESGGNIIALGTFQGDNTELSGVMLKVNGINSMKCQDALKGVVEKVIDIRETAAG